MGQLMKKHRFKNFIPKSLLKRTVIIIVTPLILVQAISFFVFWDRYVDSVTRTNADNISSSIHLVLKLRRDHNSTLPIVENRLGIDSHFYPGKNLKNFQFNNTDSWGNDYLANALEKRLSHDFTIDSDDQFFKIYIAVKGGVLNFNINRKRLISRTAPLVFIWGIGASIFFLIIAILFMKNQVRPIRNLALAAEKFGKGDDFIDFKESGATEVRQAGLAFNKMRERIRKQIQQRTDMLAAISHDLRTPLTRMKLEMEMMKDSKEKELLKKEVTDMQNMIGEYLEFVKGDTLEFAEETDVSNLLKEVCNQFSKQGLEIKCNLEKNVRIKLKPGSIRRVFNNVIENAKRYASKALVSLKYDPSFVTISIEDNGPGVMKEQYQEILKPFVRLDVSRSLKTGGVGLGLSIVTDIVVNHGGTLNFDKSSLGGLKVIIQLPR